VITADLDAATPTITVQLPRTRHGETVEPLALHVDGGHRNLLDGGAQLAALLRHLEQRNIDTDHPCRATDTCGGRTTIAAAVVYTRRRLQAVGGHVTTAEPW
jgi:hypothetical protein